MFLKITDNSTGKIVVCDIFHDSFMREVVAMYLPETYRRDGYITYLINNAIGTWNTFCDRRAHYTIRIADLY
jgi:hypothetical protein